MMPTSNVEPTLLARQNRFQALLAVLVILVCLLLGTSMYLLYEQSSRIAQNARINKANSSLLVECTTPPELRNPPVVVPQGKTRQDCYLRSRQETGKVVQSIRDISVAAAACGAAYPGDVERTQACVNKTLEDK